MDQQTAKPKIQLRILRKRDLQEFSINESFSNTKPDVKGKSNRSHSRVFFHQRDDTIQEPKICSILSSSNKQMGKTKESFSTKIPRRNKFHLVGRRFKKSLQPKNKGLLGNFASHKECNIFRAYESNLVV